MRNSFFSFSILSFWCLGLFSCSSAQQVEEQNTEQKNPSNAEVAYKILHRYFVKNTVADDFPEFSVLDKNEFEAVAGMATVMGENGRPTTIDFETEKVVAIILPTTDHTTEIGGLEWEKLAQGWELRYEVQVGEKMSYTQRPCLFVSVSKDIAAQLTGKRK